MPPDPPQTLKGHTEEVTALRQSGSSVYSGSRDATVRVWDVRTAPGKQVAILDGARCVCDDGVTEVSQWPLLVNVWHVYSLTIVSYQHTTHCLWVYAIAVDSPANCVCLCACVRCGSQNINVCLWDEDGVRLCDGMLVLILHGAQGVLGAVLVWGDRAQFESEHCTGMFDGCSCTSSR